MENKFYELLKNNDLKITKNRIAILEELSIKETPVTAEEIFNSISKKHTDKYSLSSVYRALNHFCEKSIIRKIAEIDGTTYFQLKNIHSHSLICIKCKKIIPINHCPITPVIDEIENKTKFIVTTHHLEIKGICENCIKNIPTEEIKNIKSSNKCETKHQCKDNNCI